uniref:Gluconate 5-dehydrogenase n=1 Tax=Chrysotila carterae TaxID=13221 RepID=A0A7S4F9P5_CHRCT|mmetsp:Transcript_40373/g.84671  ORF Transcript_40373/g.84671 Transcript_40373/m.84671 type:complete len:269 (-) Transcript_40373:130-936(-)|eukprot:2812695-Pleurochrysis_carterae.AAC.3
MDRFSLVGHSALVTGGGTGIGAAIARGLAQAGACVVVAGRRLSPLEKTAAHINQQLSKTACWPLQCDVTDFSRADSIMKTASGLTNTGAAITVLVNNAGVNVRQPASELTEAHWRESLDLMLVAPFSLARACAPAWAAQGYGRVINIASLQSSLAFPDSIPYAASKSGVLGLTRALAEAYSPPHGFSGVTCNAIAPGYVSTDLTRSVFADAHRARMLAAKTIAGRNSVPDDLAGPAVFLASSAAAYVNGQLLNVDGGFTALGQSIGQL